MTAVLVDGEWIAFRLKEALDVTRFPKPEPPAGLTGWRLWEWQRKHPRPEPEYRPSGRLALEYETAEFGIQHVWRDRQSRRVETHLNAFVGNLFLAADTVKQKRAEAELRRLEAIEEAKRREERRRLRYQFEQREKVLKGQMERWERAEEIRRYLTAAKQALAAGAFSEEETEEIEVWLDWIGHYAESFDPLRELAGEAGKGVNVEEMPSWWR
jgi:hypothetical protein